MDFIATYIFPIAGVLWNFFSLIGKIAVLPIYEVLSGNAVVYVNNPFGFDDWTVNINPNFDIMETVTRWVLNVLNIPNVPFFAGFLLVVGIAFAVLLFAKLILGIFT